ncbi:hypothetical protein [Plantactinospora sp. CA-290183]|uniref:hypothetical protein n=1 Tax=Plantactinospora sp. CA-290183 TaxID=3240006 RepID=UPI003D8D5C0C
MFVGGFVAVVTAAALGPVAPAAADPVGLEKVGFTTGATSADKSVSVSCPAGKVVTGGGGYLTASPAALGQVALDRLEPLAGGSGFFATMREAGDDNFLGTWKLTGQAVCAPAPAGWQIVSVTGAAETEYVTASCGTKRVIGTGARVNGGAGNVVLDQVQPSADLRTVRARGVPIPGADVPAGWSVTTFAVCATQPAGLERISFPAGPDEEGEAALMQSCPAGKALYGTGADINAGNGQVLLSGVNVSTLEDTSAWANEDGAGPPNSWTLTGYGICAS